MDKKVNKIVIIGSINLDTTIRTEYLAKPGETIHSKEMFSSGGGKGANQAISAARNGAKVSFIGAVGNDNAGSTLVDLLEQDSIETTGIEVLNSMRTGSAYINVSDDGENSIIIYGGANQSISDEHIDAMKHAIKGSDYLIAQLETNLSSIKKGFEIAKKYGVKTILNPAPALKAIPESIIALTDILIPNESELEIIAGFKVTNKNELVEAVNSIHKKGIDVVIVTLGSKGVMYSIKNQKNGFVPAFKVKAVDTTAAGDTFIGALATKLSADLSNIEEAIKYGNKAASLTVQRYGAQPSIPYETEVNQSENE